MTRNWTASLFVLLASLPLCTSVHAIAISWDDGGVDKNWSTTANWSPNGSPAGDDLTIGDLLAGLGDTTIVDQDFSVASLTVLGGADVDVAGNQLVVNGASSFTSDGTTLLLRLHTTGDDPLPSIITDSLFVGTGAAVEMYDDSVLEVDNGVFFLNGTLRGNGEIQLNDSVASPTSLLSITGTLSVGVPGLVISPPPRTLRITASDADARLDFDGAGAANIFLQQNATLDIDVPIADDAAADPFSGTIGLGPASTLDVSSPWQLGGTINVNTSALALTETATITGALLTLISGSQILLDETDESLRLAAPLAANNGSTISNFGTVIFDAPAQFGTTANFQLLGTSGSLVANADVDIVQNSFDIDGSGLTTNQVTVNPGAVLTLNIDDFGAGDLTADGMITINSGELSALVGTGWTADGTIHLNNTNGSPAVISAPASHTFTLGDGVGISDANLVVGGAGESRIAVRGIRFSGGSDVDVAADAALALDGIVTFQSANATFDGGGTLRFGGPVHVDAATTLNVAAVGLEGDGNSTVEVNAALTINAAAIEDGGDGVDSTIVIADPGLLTVNISGGGAWTVGPEGGITYDGLGPDHTFLAGSNVVLNGPLNIDGSAITSAVLNIGAVEVNLHSGGLSLSGGDGASNTNTIAGGTINGPGTLRSGGTRRLVGFGTINAPINFGVAAGIKADNGTLTINGSIVDVGVIGTDDSDGILHVVANWNSSVADIVDLLGGELMGGAITIDNPNGVTGFGLVSARVINNQRIRAQAGTLVIETAANNNDWDGTLGTGRLAAGTGHLEIRDNATFLFGGTVEAINNRSVFANGFELEFQPASTLLLTAGTYRSTHATDIGGTVTIGPGTSTLQVDGTAVFENGSSTTLTGDLQLNNSATRIDAGAAFSGTGSLINVAGRTLTLADGADVDVTLQNDGTLEIGASAGQTQGLDLSQSASGAWNVEIGGTGLNDFDRIALSGIASLNGALNLSLIDGYLPELTDPPVTILTASVRNGMFLPITQPAGMPAGLGYEVIYNPTNVTLQIVEVGLPGDYNANGVVDAADYTVWRDHLNQAFELPGENPDALTPGVVDAEDFAFWKSQFGNLLGGGSSQPSAKTNGLLANRLAVPEPSALCLAIFGVLAVGIRSRVRIRAEHPCSTGGQK